MLSGIRILIVEDEPLSATALSDAVENAGGTRSWGSPARSARRIIKVLAFDMAVLDLHLAIHPKPDVKANVRTRVRSPEGAMPIQGMQRVWHEGVKTVLNAPLRRSPYW